MKDRGGYYEVYEFLFTDQMPPQAVIDEVAAAYKKVALSSATSTAGLAGFMANLSRTGTQHTNNLPGSGELARRSDYSAAMAQSVINTIVMQAAGLAFAGLGGGLTGMLAASAGFGADGLYAQDATILSPRFESTDQTGRGVVNRTVEGNENRWTLRLLQAYATSLTEYVTKYDPPIEAEDPRLKVEQREDGLSGDEAADIRLQGDVGLKHTLETYVTTRMAENRTRTALGQPQITISVDDFMNNYLWEQDSTYFKADMLYQGRQKAREILALLPLVEHEFYSKTYDGFGADSQAIAMLKNIADIKIKMVKLTQVTLPTGEKVWQRSLQTALTPAEQAAMDESIDGLSAKEKVDLFSKYLDDPAYANAPQVEKDKHKIQYVLDYDGGTLDNTMKAMITDIEKYQKDKNSIFDGFFEKAGFSSTDDMIPVGEMMGLLTHNIVTTSGGNRIGVTSLLEEAQNEYRAFIEERRQEAKRTAYNQAEQSERRNAGFVGGEKDMVYKGTDLVAYDKRLAESQDVMSFLAWQEPAVPAAGASSED